MRTIQLTQRTKKIAAGAHSAALRNDGIHLGMAAQVLKRASLPPAKKLSTFDGLLSTLEVTIDPYAPPQDAALRALLQSEYARLSWHIDVLEATQLRSMPTAFSVFVDQLANSGKEHLLLFSLCSDIAFSPQVLSEYLELTDSIPQPCIIDPEHRSWKTAKSEAQLKQHKVSIVSLDAPKLFGIIKDASYVSPKRGYLRLLGRDPKKWFEPLPERHQYDYSKEELADIAARIRALRQNCEEVTVVFSTYPFEAAYKNALALTQHLASMGPV